jgi:hypothetical protein
MSNQQRANPLSHVNLLIMASIALGFAITLVGFWSNIDSYPILFQKAPNTHIECHGKQS